MGFAIATTGSILLKCGKNCNLATSNGLTSGARIAAAARQAESFLHTSCRTDWSGAYATLSPDVKYVLEDLASCVAAMYLINYDMSGYTSRQEVLTMLNVLWARTQECLKLLGEEEYRDFVEGA